MTNAPKYYKNVVGCSDKCSLVANCNLDSTLGRRWLPRGTTSRAVPGNVDLMIIATNPGRPQAIEDDIYKVGDLDELADRAWDFTERTLEGRTGFSTTLDQLIREAAFLLDCEPRHVLDRCIITNHVRCSTPSSYSSYRRLESRPVSQRCVMKHLVPEIAYWRPRKIAVFSAIAKDVLESMRISYDGYIAHPAARGKNLNREYRKLELKRLKCELGFI